MDAPNSPTTPPHPAAELHPAAGLHVQATAALSALVDGVAPEQWDRPSPCEGWTARDVLDHLIGTERDFVEARGFDPGPAPDTTADPAGSWHRHLDTITPLVTDPEVLATPYDG